MEVFGTAFVAFLVAIGPMAITCTKVVDTVRNVADPADTFPKVTWNVVSLAAGLVIALLFEYNFMAPLVAAVPALASQGDHLQGTWGQVLTGLAIGYTASAWHERMDFWSAGAKTVRAEASSRAR